jgi:hypothetical protein
VAARADEERGQGVRYIGAAKCVKVVCLTELRVGGALPQCTDTVLPAVC